MTSQRAPKPGSSRMAAGCAESPRPKAAPGRPAAGQAGVLPCLELPSYAAACALVSSRYSCLVAGPHRRHIALSPRYLSRKRTGIREQLDAELLRYSERYGLRRLPSGPLSLRGVGMGSGAAEGRAHGPCVRSPHRRPGTAGWGGERGGGTQLLGRKLTSKCERGQRASQFGDCQASRDAVG